MITFENKKIIVFDLDYTIVKLKADWHSLRAELNKRYTKVYGEVCNFETMSACLSKIVEKQDWEQLDNFFQIMRRYELENIEETSLIHETIYFINNLHLFGVRKNVKIAILSLNTRQTIKKSLELAGIAEKVGFYIGREDVRSWKPNPEGLFKIQEFFKVNTEEMIFFGDSDKDVLAGEKAGIEAYYIDDLIREIRIKMK
jgi:phosphoglycolate phosphatase